MKTAEFGQPCKAPEPGRCRICGGNENEVGLAGSINWVDETRTLCESPDCIAAARAELTISPAESDALRRPYEGKRYGFAPRRGR